MALEPMARTTSAATPIATERTPDGLAARPRAAQFGEHGEVHVDPAVSLTAEQIAFVGQLNSLGKRVAKNHFWAREEIFLLLENAATIAIVAGDLVKAELVLEKATQIYERALLARNRIQYVSGTALGVIALVFIGFVVVRLGASGAVTAFPSTDIVIELLVFAGIGSVTSVLMRLSTLDLNDETSKPLLMLSGASKPLVAVAFAIIVYLILKYRLLALTIGQSTDPSSPDAAFWVAAFLCGFSERFGSDIINRLELQSPAQK
jgi:hypothetical protein